MRKGYNSSILGSEASIPRRVWALLAVLLALSRVAAADTVYTPAIGIGAQGAVYDSSTGVWTIPWGDRGSPEIQLTDSGDAGKNPVPCTWDFGDGRSEPYTTIGPLSVFYSAPGTYTITLTVGAASATAIVKVLPPPPPPVNYTPAITIKNATWDPTSFTWVGLQGQEYEFIDSGDADKAATTCTWNLNDGTPPKTCQTTDTGCFKAAFSPNNYPISLTVGGWLATTELAIQPVPPPPSPPPPPPPPPPSGGGSLVCLPGPTVLCIDGSPGDKRFEVTASFQTSQSGGSSGKGQAVPLSSVGMTHGGAFWFFSADNPELFVKVLNTCSFSGHMWVFASANTNVGITLTVTDTKTGAQKIYTNPDLQPMQAVQDTEAFACP